MEGVWSVARGKRIQIVHLSTPALYRIRCDAGPEVELHVTPGLQGVAPVTLFVVVGNSLDVEAAKIDIVFHGPDDFASGAYDVVASME